MERWANNQENGEISLQLIHMAEKYTTPERNKKYIKRFYWHDMFYSLYLLFLLITLLLTIAGLISFYNNTTGWLLVIGLPIIITIILQAFKFLLWLNSKIKPDEEKAVTSFFELLHIEGWTRELDQFYKMIPNKDFSHYPFRELLTFAVNRLEADFRKYPSGSTFTESRAENLPMTFEELINPYYSIWLYEKLTTSLSLNFLPEIIQDVHNLKIRNHAREQEYKISRKLAEDKELKQKEFLFEKLSEARSGDDWRKAVKYAEGEYIQEFGQLCPYEIRSLNGEWEITKS